MKYALVEVHQDQMVNTSIVCLGSKEECIERLKKEVTDFVSSSKDGIEVIEGEYVEDIEAGCSEYESVDELVENVLSSGTTDFELVYMGRCYGECWNWSIVKAA